MSEKKIRLGVVGIGRGAYLAQTAVRVGMEVVAICDNQWPERLAQLGEQYGAGTYSDYDKFLDHDMDAVLVANYFHQHAPFAIKALESGRHVMSECIACKTLAEGAALARAVEKSGKIYMFAENYAYMAYVQEMRRLYIAGEIGEVRYAEGEYNHPILDPDGLLRMSPGVNHWRHICPSTYYCTHAMSPIMHVTDTRPVSINAQSIALCDSDDYGLHLKRNDPGSVMIIRMDNGSVARLFGLWLKGHSLWYRFHGTRGLMENLRTGNGGYLRVMHDPPDAQPGQPKERIYAPEFPVHADLAAAAGHGGGDFFVNYHFAEAIRKNEQPYMDVYRGLDMSLIAVQGWRSCLANGQPFEIPDFRDEEARKRYENDHWSPFPEDHAPGQPWPSIRGDVKPDKDALDHARRIWDQMGYRGD